MKSTKVLLLLLISIISSQIYGQRDLSNYKAIEGVKIISHWGDINIVGTKSNNSQNFNVEAFFTDTSKKKKQIIDFPEYMRFELKNKILFVETRKPKGFESIDLKLKIPANLFIEVMLIKGGNISVSNFSKGVEINSLNGSVKLENIEEYALVNATNGEIKASFNKINRKKPISLVTLNGGISIFLPKNSKRDLRIISRKNGYVESDFEINGHEKISNLNHKEYSKNPIIAKGKINGGGELLFLSTENGPISIKKQKE